MLRDARAFNGKDENAMVRAVGTAAVIAGLVVALSWARRYAADGDPGEDNTAALQARFDQLKPGDTTEPEVQTLLDTPPSATPTHPRMPERGNMLRRLFASVVRPPYVWLRNGITNLLFERRLGVQTSGDVELGELGIAADGRVNYGPVGWLMLRRILPPSTVTADDVFLDIGSGKGRAVLLAATYPFRRVIGVELSTLLVEIAQDNLDRARNRLRCTNVEFINADAVGYEIPDDVSVIFMNNPLRGANFAAVVENVLRSYDRRPRTLRIVYANPIEERTLLSTGRFQMIRQTHGFRPGREWSRSNSCRMYSVHRS